MKGVSAVLVLLLIGFVCSAPIEYLRPGIVPVLVREDIRDDYGQYYVSYLTGDGTTFQEQGALKPRHGRTDHVLVKQGSFSFTAPDGKAISLVYEADENGFRAKGAHLPVPPQVIFPKY